MVNAQHILLRMFPRFCIRLVRPQVYFILALLSALDASAQRIERDDLQPDSATHYRIELIDGSVVVGTVVDLGKDSLTISSQRLERVKLSLNSIAVVARLDALNLRNGTNWFPNPNDSRYLVSPNAIPLRRGAGLYRNTYLVLQSFDIGLSDRVSIGGGFELVSIFSRNKNVPAHYLTAKISAPLAKKLHIGITGVYISLPYYNRAMEDVRRRLSGALCMATYGTSNSQLTGGFGWGYDGSRLLTKPAFMLSGIHRFSRRTAVISENWMASDSKRYDALFSYGLRFMGKSIAVDLAFLNNQEISKGLFIGIPFASFTLRL